LECADLSALWILEHDESPLFKALTSQCVPGLYFIGEVLDVTGQLGGYNFQWAWASAFAAGQVV